MAIRREGEQVAPSDSTMDAPKQNRSYALQARGEQKSPPNVATGLIYRAASRVPARSIKGITICEALHGLYLHFSELESLRPVHWKVTMDNTMDRDNDHGPYRCSSSSLGQFNLQLFDPIHWITVMSTSTDRCEDHGP
ncbi:hypothetical protein MTR67_034953 [Solanum verrucosum]|uniref:Uncharacterized protein n=1 Tax=Solanum verrucosum TaxID=315347 RepID=A0AAF0ZL00_SOLVR|nr:hypothetical protein MTR67_034953 [Solanum verrucosum]